ncbi:MAG: hypothetical protein ICV74_05885 [Thermoleophilia bacterium]|nr:hypothetical protein [Thermoleophilia bacterium]
MGTSELALPPGLARTEQDVVFVTVARPDDLVLLEVGWRGLELRVAGQEGEEIASLASDGASEGVLVARFPPQAIEEDAYFETDPSIGAGSDPPPGERPLPDVVGSRIAAATRLAFTVPKDFPPIPFTVSGLLEALTELPLRVHPDALPRQRLGMVRPGLRELVDAVLAAKALAGGTNPKALAAELAVSGSARAESALQERVVSRLEAARHLPGTHQDVVNYLRVERFSAETALVPEGAIENGTLTELASIGASRWTGGRWLRRRFRPPAADETSIELPYKLVLSPHAAAGFAHAAEPRRARGRVELWHSRLGTQTERGVNETDGAARTVRAVWARSGAPLGFPMRRGEPDRPRTDAFGSLVDTEPPYTSLDADDRWSIVHLTSDFVGYRPEPVDVRRLMLTSLGGWLDSQGMWTRPYPEGIALSEWRHLATMARDHYVRVVYEGMLFPFGHRAALVKVTERRFHPETRGNAAYLRQRMFIVLREQERTYAAPGISEGGELLERTLPFHRIRIRTQVTPPLDDPNLCQLAPPTGYGRKLFWPKVGGKPFPFDVVAETIDGTVEFTAPAIFGSFDEKPAPPRNPGLMTLARAAYEKEPASRVPLGGQRVTLARPNVNGDTTFALESLSLSAHVLDAAGTAALDAYYELPAPPERRPCFFPKLRAFDVHLPAVQVLSGANGASSATFARAYAGEPGGDGFGGANKGEVLLAISSGPPLDFSSKGDRSGGLVQPSLAIKGLSRKLGPVSGTAGADGLQEIADGSFKPADFFAGPLGPKLFGAISLADVVAAAGLGDLDKVPKFVTELSAPAEALVTALSGLAARAAALKAAAPSGPVGTETTALADALAADVATVSGDLAALASGSSASGFPAHLAGLSGHLDDALVLLEKLPSDVPGDLRNGLRAAVERTKGLVADAGAILDALKLVDELSLRFEWSPELRPASVFVPSLDGRQATLTVSVEAQAKSRVRPEPTLDVSARLTDFTIELIRGSEEFLRLRFQRVEFLAPPGRKPDVNVDFAGVEFVGVLSFVEALRSLIPLDGFSDPPGLTVDAEGVRAQYSLGLPTIAFGVFTLQNLSLGAGFSIPFIGRPLSVRFNFCERQQPFLLTVMAFGGGGYFVIAVDPAGVQELEAGFEFGASLAMNFGVASGEVHVLGGFVYAIKDGNASLDGFLRIGGNVQALGIVSVCIELALALHYEFSSGKCVGRATLTIEVEIAFFSASVEITCERKFAGSNGDPTFAQIMPPPAWRAYCEAFADE